MKELAYKIVKVEDIKVSNRARKDFGEIGDLALSINDKGLFHPPLIDQKMNLLAGERRLKAFKELGREEIPVFVKHVDSVLDGLEIELLENLVRKDLTWPEHSILVKKLDEHYRSTHDKWSGRKTAEVIGRSVGGVARQLQLADALEQIPEIGKLKTEDEAMKKISKIQGNLLEEELLERMKRKTDEMSSALSATMKYAKASYLVGDAFKGLAKLPNEDLRLSFAEVDPPYGIDLKKKKRQQSWNSEELKEYTDIPKEEYISFLNKLTKELFRVLSQDATFVFWYSYEWYHDVLEALLSAGFLVDHIPCIWSKKQGQTQQEKINLARTHETFLYGRKPKAEFGVFKEGRSNVFEFTGVYPADKRHPTQRPIPLIKELIETFGAFLPPQKRTILSPFLGSGATIIAANELGYKALGWDISLKCQEKFLLEIRRNYELKFIVK